MEQLSLNLNKPQPSELWKKSDAQARRIYERLLLAPITNAEIYDPRGLNIPCYSRRISDIREKLEPFLLDVKATRIKDGLFEYSITGN
jgi:hypothetical protein